MLGCLAPVRVILPGLHITFHSSSFLPLTRWPGPILPSSQTRAQKGGGRKREILIKRGRKEKMLLPERPVDKILGGRVFIFR